MDGKRIGKFRILHELGRGGMGVVYLAEDEQLNRKVALKFLKKSHLDREKILSEARLASQLNHSGVVTIYDVIDTPEGTCIVMEYVDGETLADFLGTHRVGIPLALRFAKELVEIVAVAHRNNLVHGDLKPGNVFITADGKVKLLDFGLAGIYHDMPESEAMSGTFPYIAPEQITGSAPTFQSDIYALGMILYEIFTGVLPFQKENQAAQIYASIHEIPRDPTELNKKVTPSLAKIILRCLDKEPRRRFHSAKNLLLSFKAIESESTREVEKSDNRFWLIPLFAMFVILGIASYFLFQRERQVQVQSLEEIRLPEPVTVQIDYRLNQTIQTEAQIRIYSLAEILREHLQRIAGLKILLNGLNARQTSSQNNSDQKNFLMQLSVENRAGSPFLSYSFVNEAKDKTRKYEIPWLKFDDLKWISRKVMTDWLDFLLDKKTILNETPADISKNINVYQHFAYALYYYNEGNYSLGIKKCDQALAINPFFARAHYMKGLLLSKKGEYRQAIDEFYEALPEANKRGIIDWQFALTDSGEQDFRLSEVKYQEGNIFKNTRYLCLYKLGSKEVVIITPEDQTTRTISFPGRENNFIIQKINFYQNKFIFFVKMLNTRKGRLFTYSPEKNEFTRSPWFHYSLLKINIPYFDFLDRDSQMIKHIDVRNVENIFSMKFNIGSLSRYFFPGQSETIGLFDDNDAYTVDFEKKKVERFHFALFDTLKKLHRISLLQNTPIYIDDSDRQIKIYDLLSSKLLARIPVLKSDDYRLGIRNYRRNYRIDRTKNEIYLFYPDTTFRIYKVEKNLKIHCSYSFDIKKHPGSYIYIPQVSLSPSQTDIFLWSKESGTILLFDPEKRTEGISLKISSRTVRPPFITDKYIFLPTGNQVMGIEKSSGKIFWRLKGRFPFFHWDPRTNILVFSEKNASRLAFYQYTTRRFLGFFQYESKRPKITRVYQSHLCFCEQQSFKKINLNTLVTRDPIHTANIYEKIAQNYFALKSYTLVEQITNKILDEYQPNNLDILFLQLRCFLATNNKRKMVRLLPRLYNFLPETHIFKKQLVDLMKGTGLYLWETPVKIQQGERYLNSTDRGLLYSDMSTATPNVLYRLDFHNGNILWRRTFGYKFNGIPVTPGLFLLSQAPNLQQPVDYSLLNLETGTIEGVFEQTSVHRSSPKFYPVSTQQVLAAYQAGDDHSLELINLNTQRVKQIIKLNHHFSSPFVYHDSILFISNDSLYSYDVSSGTLSVERRFPFTSSIRRILFVNSFSFLVEDFRSQVLNLKVTTGEIENLGRARFATPGLGFINTQNEYFYFAGNRMEKIKLEKDMRVKQVFQNRERVFMLEQDRICQIENGKTIHIIPLLWSALNFTVKDNHAFVLSADSKIYCVNLNWRPEKLKKGLISILNQSKFASLF